MQCVERNLPGRRRRRRAVDGVALVEGRLPRGGDFVCVPRAIVVQLARAPSCSALAFIRTNAGGKPNALSRRDALGTTFRDRVRLITVTVIVVNQNVAIMVVAFFPQVKGP